MPSLPDIRDQDRKKPLCYDPERQRFIYFDEIVSGKERIVPLERLDHEQVKKLIIERNRVGPDYKVQVMSGKSYSRDDVVKEINSQTEFGNSAVEAEVSHLSDLLKQIEDAIKHRRCPKGSM